MLVKKISLRGTMLQMKEGQEIEVPLSLRTYSCVRSTASILTTDVPGCKFKVHLDREKAACIVKRLS